MAPVVPTPAAASSVAGTPGPLSGTVRQTGTTLVPAVRALDWTAQGFTKIVGNVEVDTGRAAGSLIVGGSVTARRLSLAGQTRIEGDLNVAEDLRTKGTVRVGQSVSSRSGQLTGTVEVSGSLSFAGGLEWEGSLEVGQDFRADTMLFRGRMAVQGTLSAHRISGEIESQSSVRSIEADWVDIRRRKSLLPPIFLLPPPQWHDLEADRIEAAEVHLAGVRVRRLKADRIWLGPGTHVEYVEGTIVEQHKEAHVGPESESPPPPGLSR